MKARLLQISILTAEHPAERALRGTLAALLIFGAALYMYFVAVSIINIIERKDALVEAGAKASAVAELEEKYFKRAELIANEDPISFGLVPLESKRFVERAARLGALTPAGNEI